MHERQIDAISYVRKFGRPDLFITMTCNPKWEEIKDSLYPGQEAHDRPDIVARVYRQKHNNLMNMITKEGIFGAVRAWLYSIEFQKRGLPHTHILVWLLPNSKIRPEQIDLAISAEIPDREEDPNLHNIVMANMVHGPCGPLNRHSPCMRDGRCSKDFPKAFLQCTEQGSDSYPKYRRRQPADGGNTGILKMRQDGRIVEQQVTSQWIVPYNSYLLRKFNCHLNVEICSSIKSIKYVLKYVTKGTDQAIFQLQQTDQADEGRQTQTQQARVVNEITEYQSARYVGSSEAAWRIFQMPMHEHFPPVVQLAVHLENGQRVYFRQAEAMRTATEEAPITTLTAFFNLCRVDDFARTLKYVDVPEYYTWGRQSWNRRKRGTPVDGPEAVFRVHAIGRMYTISPRQGECYFLRLLLNEVCLPFAITS